MVGNCSPNFVWLCVFNTIIAEVIENQGSKL